MARKKLEHFAELRQWDHVIEEGPMGSMLVKTAGAWGPRVVVELGCGGGEYTVGLAQRFPEAMVVGVDIKGARLWHGASRALGFALSNVRFLRIRIENLARYFAEAEVDEIWITFPDPHPTKGNAKRRLTSPRFLEIYRHLLKPGGLLRLKTDDEALFDFSLASAGVAGFEEVRVLRDVYAPGVDAPLLQEVQTAYEKKYLKEGRKILYAEWRV